MRIGPLIALAIISCINLGMAIQNHKKPREKENAWATLIGWLFQWGLILWAVL